MKISIVTPIYDRYDFLEDTIESVLCQKGDFDLEYIIQNGGSDSRVLAILEKWERKLADNLVDIGCSTVDFKYFCEKDDGMYDAINKGFLRTSGDILAWINSDDMYHPYAFQTVVQIFSEHESVKWLTGIPNSFNNDGARAGYDIFPKAYSKSYIKRGYYRIDNCRYGFNWVQQESTFWRKELWQQVGSAIDSGYKYAADFYLWQTFAQFCDLVKVKSFLGGFRVHGNQVTADPHLYTNELPVDEKPPSLLRGLHFLSTNFAMASNLLHAVIERGKWARFFGVDSEDLHGRVVEWSFDDQQWIVSKTRIL